MRLRLLSVVVAVLAVALGATSAKAFIDRTVDARLKLVHVGRDGRTLVFTDSYGGCQGRARVTQVHETRSSITVRASRPESVPEPRPEGEPQEGCTDELRLAQVRVRLRHRVRGRRILGVGYGSSDLSFGAPAVPRVRGLAPTDARRVLKARAYRTRTRYLRHADRFPSRVVAQSPAPGPIVYRPRRTVTLYVRR